MAKKTATLVGILLIYGIIGRAVLIPSVLSFVGSDFLFAILAGSIYDLTLIGYLLLLVALLPAKGKNASQQALFSSVYIGYGIFVSFDIFSLRYTGVRTSLTTLNLFSIGDLAGKVTAIQLLVFVSSTLLLGVGGYIVSVKIPRLELPNFRYRVLLAAGGALLTLVYLPFPLNYYSDQMKASSESKQIALTPYYSWAVSIFHPAEKFLISPDKAVSEFRLKHGFTDGSAFPVRHVNYPASDIDNVILIVLESFGANRVGILKGERKLSPVFDSLSAYGVLYDRCFACGPRTQYGITSLMFGFPHILGFNVFRENKQKVPFEGLHHLLERNGFNCHFLHGGAAGYDDMGLLLKAGSKIQIRDCRDIHQYKLRNSWGVDDESFLDYALSYIQSQKGKNFYCLLTMTNHEPHELPTNYIKDSELSDAENCFKYTDKALGRFINQIASWKLVGSSLIIITGDHGEKYQRDDKETKLFHVPLLVLDHGSTGVKHHPVSHADVGEYILSRVGYHGKSNLLGLGIVNSNRSAEAYYRDYDNNLYKVTDSILYKYNIQRGDLTELELDAGGYVSKRTNIRKTAGKMAEEEINSTYSTLQYLFQSGKYRAY
jgi:phosphoglycerol transferase MdoB-like AlkP superfamily enzyme